MLPQIVQVVEGVPTVSHRVVAENVGIEAKSILDIITRNQGDFQEFGTLAFLNRESIGGRPSKEYMLNEQQATLLMTYLKNSPIVRQFKIALVKAFFNLRESKTQSMEYQVDAMFERILMINKELEELRNAAVNTIPTFKRAQGAPLSDTEKEMIIMLRREKNWIALQVTVQTGISQRSQARVLRSLTPKEQQKQPSLFSKFFGNVA